MSADVAPALRRLFVGSYTDGADRGGIRTIVFGEGGGEAHVVRADGCGANPTYLAQRGSLLFAAHELDSCGRMAAYAIEPDGSLTCRGACTAPYDAGTCFVLPDPNGRNLFGANYLSGSVACCALLDDGRLAAGVPSRRHEGRGLRDDRQEGPHVHSLSFVPGTRLLVAVDLGLDALVIYQVDACGMLAPTAAETVRVPAGSGPRIVAYHPRLPMAALVNELACDVLVFRIDEGGLHWWIVEQLSLPQAPSGDALAAHIAFSPDGRQLYASVRGSDQLVVFPVDGQGRVAGRCDVASGGKGPRHFSLSPDGRFLAACSNAMPTGCCERSRAWTCHNRRASSGTRKPRAAATQRTTETRQIFRAFNARAIASAECGRKSRTGHDIGRHRDALPGISALSGFFEATKHPDLRLNRESLPDFAASTERETKRPNSRLPIRSFFATLLTR